MRQPGPLLPLSETVYGVRAACVRQCGLSHYNERVCKRRVQNSRWSWQGRLSCLFAACFRGSCALNRSCGPIWRAHEETETRKVKSGADDARPFYTTRSYWLQKQRVLFSDLLDRVKKTGTPLINVMALPHDSSKLWMQVVSCICVR